MIRIILLLVSSGWKVSQIGAMLRGALQVPERDVKDGGYHLQLKHFEHPLAILPTAVDGRDPAAPLACTQTRKASGQLVGL